MKKQGEYSNCGCYKAFEQLQHINMEALRSVKESETVKKPVLKTIQTLR